MNNNAEAVENTREIYVGASRAQRLLAIVAPKIHAEALKTLIGSLRAERVVRKI